MSIDDVAPVLVARAALAVRKYARAAVRPAEDATVMLRPSELRALSAVLQALAPEVEAALESQVDASVRAIQGAFRQWSTARAAVRTGSVEVLRLQCAWRGRLIRQALPHVRMRWAAKPRDQPSALFMQPEARPAAAAMQQKDASGGTPSPVRIFHSTGRGRGLEANRAFRAGEEVLREFPTAQVLGAELESASATAECHDMLAQLLCASASRRFCRPVGELVSLIERHKELDAPLLDEVATKALPAVRRLVEEMAGAAPALALDAEALTCTYCKHLLNSMTILDAESLQPLGMALYARHGALLNHDSQPNCWTLFEPCVDDAGRKRYMMILRTLAAVAEGEELTIAYVDVAKPRAQLNASLSTRYFIPSPAEAPSAGRPSGLEALQQVERIGQSTGRSFLRAHRLAAEGGEGSGSSQSVAEQLRNCAAALAKEGGGGVVAEGEAKRATDQLERVALAHHELSSLLAGDRSEPAVLVPAVSRELDACTRAGDWAGALVACQQLLYLYRYCYRIVYPQVGIRYLTAGLAALKQPEKDLATSQSMLQKAVRILGVTHGEAHEVTTSATETLGLVSQLLRRSAGAIAGVKGAGR